MEFACMVNAESNGRAAGIDETNSSQDSPAAW